MTSTGEKSAMPFTRAQWDAIPLARRAPMQHFIWQQACVEALANGDDVECLQVESAGGLRAAIILLRSGFPARLRLIGAEELWEPVEAPCTDEDAADALAAELLARGAPLRFGHHPAQSLLVDALRRRAPDSGFLFASPVAGSPFIRLNERWREPEAALSSGRRSDLRRMARKASAHGERTIELFAPEPQEAGRLLERAVEVEARGWKSRAGTSLAVNQKQAAFFRHYAALAAEAGILRVLFLRLGGVIAAMQLAVETDDAFWLFKIGFDERFADCSPGNLLMLEAIRYAAQKGLASFEFLGKSAAWTRMWTEDERANIRLRYYPRTPSGLVALAGDGAEAALRRSKTLFASREVKSRG